jgi:hypothetical protein
MKRATSIAISFLVVLILWSPGISAKGDDFNSVVKMIEEFYNVKHQGFPFLAKAGLKVVGIGAKIKGGNAKYLAEAGSVKLAIFEDQNFNGDFIKFRRMLNDSLIQTWMPLVQTLSAVEGEQTYVFLREKGDKFNVLIVTIEEHEGTVVQATLSSKSLALLLKDPEGGAKAISQEATSTDNE